MPTLRNSCLKQFVTQNGLKWSMGDDTVTGRRLMEMIQPEACMEKPEAVDCAAVEAEGLSVQAEGCILFLSLRPVMVS